MEISEASVSLVVRALLSDWTVRQRLGAVGKYGSIAVTERLIWTLKRERLARVPLIRGLRGATPAMIYRGRHWQKPDRAAKTLRGPIRLRHFPEQRITVYELAA